MRSGTSKLTACLIRDGLETLIPGVDFAALEDINVELSGTGRMFWKGKPLYKYITKSSGWEGKEAGNQHPNLWSLRRDQQHGILAQQGRYLT